MTAFPQHRQTAGTPTGGQFTAGIRPESNVTLTDVSDEATPRPIEDLPPMDWSRTHSVKAERIALTGLDENGKRTLDRNGHRYDPNRSHFRVPLPDGAWSIRLSANATARDFFYGHLYVTAPWHPDADDRGQVEVKTYHGTSLDGGRTGYRHPMMDSVRRDLSAGLSLDRLTANARQLLDWYEDPVSKWRCPFPDRTRTSLRRLELLSAVNNVPDPEIRRLCESLAKGWEHSGAEMVAAVTAAHL